MKRLTLTTIAIFSLLGPAGFAQQSTSMKHSADSTFVSKAVQGGMAEVELGKLAQERGSSAKVKDFGRQMVDDHSKANDELKKLASNKGMDVPTAIDAKSMATKERLSKLSGAEFDRAYMEDMVKDHQEDVSEFRKHSEHASDPDVKAFAAKTLPTLEGHLSKARETLSEVKKGS